MNYLMSIKFKPDDFKRIVELTGLCSNDVITDYTNTLANVANRLLEERLTDDVILDLAQLVQKERGNDE